MKYVDPSGEDLIPHTYWQIFANFDSGLKLASIIDSALKGNKSSQAYASNIMHEVGRSGLKAISDVSDTATLAFLAVGAPEGAAISGIIGAMAEGALAIDDLRGGNFEEGLTRSGIVVAGIITGKVAGRALDGIVEKGVKISVGKNGMFYSLGRSGAMKTKEGFRALLMSDIADSVFGDLTPEVASQIVTNALKAFTALEEQ